MPVKTSMFQIHYYFDPFTGPLEGHFFIDNDIFIAWGWYLLMIIDADEQMSTWVDADAYAFLTHEGHITYCIHPLYYQDLHNGCFSSKKVE